MSDEETKPHQILNREILKTEGVPEKFLSDVLEIDGRKYTKRVLNLSYDLGAIGDELSQNEYMELLSVPYKTEYIEDDEIISWDLEVTNLQCTVMTESQVKAINVEIKAGYRVCVIENKDKNKKVFFEIPELDVAQFFAEVVDDSEVDDVVKTIERKKELILGQFLTNGDEYLSFCTNIYSLWNNAFVTGDFEAVDMVMADLYPRLAPGSNYNSVESLAMYAGTSIKQEENDIPTENWWKIRALVTKMIELVSETGEFNKSFGKVVDTLNLISDNSSLYADQLWVVAIKPLMNLYCEGRGNENYDKQGFVRQIIGSEEAVKSGHILMQNDEVRALFGLEKNK